jgi:CheY-like chemotaxis protein
VDKNVFHPQDANREPSRPRVFVVDDEHALVELAASLLEMSGCDVETFASAESALAAYVSAKPAPHLVVTDYCMDGMNGLELIRECRRVNPAQKVIMISGTVNEGLYADSAAKPDRFLAKPYRVEQFTDLVQSVLAE